MAASTSPTSSAMAASTFTRIVATGGHSGLGLAALRAFIQQLKAKPDPEVVHIILYARAGHAHSAAQQLERSLHAATAHKRADVPPSLVEVREIDLESVQSIDTSMQQLADELQDEADDPAKALWGPDKISFPDAHGQIDILLLNAAVASPERRFIDDDRPAYAGVQYEATALVNHYAALEMLKVLIPVLMRRGASSRVGIYGPQIRVVFTGSALHRSLPDPVSDTLDRHFGTDDADSQDRDPTRFGTLNEHYGASKFLQLVGVLELVSRLRSQKSLALRKGEPESRPIDVIYVQPGFVPTTGLFRHSGLWGRLFMRWVLPWLIPAEKLTTEAQAGDILAKCMTLPLGQFPASHEIPPPVSATPLHGHIAPPDERPKDALPDDTFPGTVDTANGVTLACIIREHHAGRVGPRLASPDERANHSRLQLRWWLPAEPKEEPNKHDEQASTEPRPPPASAEGSHAPSAL